MTRKSRIGILKTSLFTLVFAFHAASYAATPPVASGLRLWLEADQINSADTKQVVTSNTTQFVKRWVDQSGNGFDAVQNTAAYQPILIGNGQAGKAVVRFDGINDFLATTLAQIAGDRTLFVVQRRSALASGKEISSTANVGFFLGNNSGLETKGRVGIAHDLSLPGSLNLALLKSFIRSGTSETLRVGDSVVAATVAIRRGYRRDSRL
jgi:hypothetical protein